MVCRTGLLRYGSARVDPGVLPFIPEFSASVMLGAKTPEKCSGMGSPKLSIQKDMVEMNLRNLPAAGLFPARAAYEVAEMDLEIRGRSSGESRI